MSKTGELGRQAEDQACRFLEQRGMRLLSKNFRCRFGEIDLIMQDDDMLVFVEVRFRRNQLFGGPLASITPEKQRRLLLTAQTYLQQHPVKGKHAGIRFDVVALSKNPEIEWLPNAIEAGS